MASIRLMAGLLFLVLLAGAAPVQASESKVVDIIANNGHQVSTRNLNSTLLGLMQQRQTTNNYQLDTAVAQPDTQADIQTTQEAQGKSLDCAGLADSVGFVPCLSTIAPAAGPETSAKD